MTNDNPIVSFLEPSTSSDPSITYTAVIFPTLVETQSEQNVAEWQSFPPDNCVDVLLTLGPREPKKK